MLGFDTWDQLEHNRGLGEDVVSMFNVGWTKWGQASEVLSL